MKTPLSLPNSFIIFVLGATSMLQAGTVTTTNDDTTPGSGSLRAVLAAAVNGEIIDFAPSLNGALITLTHGELPISGLEVTIDARSLPSGISISGNNLSRILNINSESNVTLNNLTLQNGKEVGGNGGALYALGGKLTLLNCTIRDSYANGTGGGLYLGNSIIATLDRCSVTGNEGKDFGGGIYLIGPTSVTIKNSVIAGNRSINGGGIYNLLGNPSISNCTIYGNAGQGLVSVFESVSTVRNSIFWGNRTGAGSVASQQIRNESPATTNVDYSLVEGAAATLHNMNGNLLANSPSFAQPTSASNAPNSSLDVRLMIGTTSINAGDNSSAAGPADRAGFPRIQNVTVDLGAFEGAYITFSVLHPTLTQSGDENHNGITNFMEYAMGVDPSDAGSISALPKISTVDEVSYLISNQRINGLDVNQVWETSTDLSIGSWQPIQPGVNIVIDSSSVPTTGRLESVNRLLDSDTTRFYRQGF